MKPTPIKPIHIMLDLETLGTVPGSVITQIGLVEFDPESDEAPIVSAMNAGLDVDLQVRRGMNISGDTLKWWMEQREVLPFIASSVSPSEAIDEILGFVTSAANRARMAARACRPEEVIEDPKVLLWGYGASFDEPLLRVLYDRFDRSWPFSYRSSRCLRSFFAQHGRVKHPLSETVAGLKHNALTDATVQALDLIETARSHGVVLS